MAKAPKILNYKNLAYEKYEFGQPFKQPSGIYQSICNYRLSKNETLPFYFETPKLKTVSGIVKLDSKYYMDLELPQTGDASSFYNYLLRTDEHNITTCHQNSKDWFNQYMPLDVVEGFYKSSVILRPNGQLPVMRVRLPSYKGNILTEIYNIKKEKINDVLCIAEGDYIVGIIEFSGLAFMSQSFYPVFELQKIKIFKENEHRVLPTGYIFSDFNEKVDLDKITTPAEEERILKEPPTSTKSTLSDAPAAPVISVAQPITITKSDGNSTKQEPIQKQLSNEPIKPIAPISIANLNENIEQILKVKEPTVVSITSKAPIIQNKTSIKSDIEKGKSFFEIVRNNTLKNALLDDDLFIQHSRGIASAYQQREANLRKYLEQKSKPRISETNIFSNISSNNTGNSPGNSNISDNENIAKSEIYINKDCNQNIPLNNKIQEEQEEEDNRMKGNTLDKLEIEPSESDTKNQDIDSQPITIQIDNNNSDMLDNINENIDNQMLEDVYNNDINSNNENDDIEFVENGNSDGDSDDGIDYKILDDLEVVVFED